MGKSGKDSSGKRRFGNGKSGRRGGKPKSSKLTLTFERKQVDSSKIKIKFKDADDEEVDEYAHTFKDGDDKQYLLAIFNEFLDFGKVYGYGEKPAKKLAQNFMRALSGDCRAEWADIFENIRPNQWPNVDEARLTTMFQSLSSTVFHKKAAERQFEAMQDGELKFPTNQTLEDSWKRYVKINDQMLFLGRGAENFTEKQLCKQLRKVLPLEAKELFVEKGGLDLTTKRQAEELLSDIDDCLETKKEVELERKSRRDRDKQRGRSNDDSDDDSTEEDSDSAQERSSEDGRSNDNPNGLKNPCSIHKTHEWKNCPNNPHSKNYKGPRSESDREEEKRKAGELNSTEQRSDNWSDEVEFVATDDDSCESEFASRGEVMALARAENKEVKKIDSHPTTIIKIPLGDGSRESILVKVLLDQCCSGKGIMTTDLAHELDYKLERIPDEEGNEYLTGGGSFKNEFQITINNLALPALSTDRTFEATFQVGDHMAGYDLIIGRETMAKIQLETLIVSMRIVWGVKNPISVPMPDWKHW